MMILAEETSRFYERKACYPIAHSGHIIVAWQFWWNLAGNIKVKKVFDGDIASVMSKVS